LLRDQIGDLVVKSIRRAQRAGALPPFEIPPVEIVRAREAAHGDYSTSVAMQSARLARMAPLLIAGAVVRHLEPAEFLAGAEVAAPGFINFRLSEAWLPQQVAAIEAAAGRYGNIEIGRGRRCQLEFISANPTGPLHMGSARNAVIGDTLARLYEAAGYQVQREYYVNDAGTQMRTFGETLFRRYLQLFGREAPLAKEHYQGLYMIDLAREVMAAHGERFLALPEDEAIPDLVEIGLASVLQGIRRSVDRLGIHFDCWFSEQSLYTDGTFERVMAALRDAGLTEFKDGAVWLRTSALGSDRDEVLIRSDGRPGYYASDVAYHFNKFVLRGFDSVVDVWAVDHQNQARRMPYLMKALGLDPNRLAILLYDLVRLYRAGQEVKLSKRSGEIITVDEVADEVGADAVRFLLLTRSNNSVMDFDLDLAVQQNDENPVYYVQYAHARVASILRMAGDRGFAPESWAKGELALLSHPAELSLVRKIVELPEVLEKAVTGMAPHHLAFYAQELAGVFHLFYRDCRVLSSDPAEKAVSEARLRLVAATKAVFARVLDLMGMTAPESL
jgi:arginyl-tRNA synthetase